MQEKYGFIYLWFDKKHKRYYLGRHWGRENDGYICSSNKMRDAYKRRPNDFKRRIISRIYTSNLDLVSEEQKWLDKINYDELNKKYYNKSKSSTTPSTKGYKHSEETKEKMSKSALGRKVSDETKEKLRKLNLGKTYSKEINAKKGISNRDYSDINFIQKMSFAAKNRSEETRKKISENNKLLQAEGKIGMKGKRHSPETIEKMRQSALKRKLNNLKNIKGV